MSTKKILGFVQEVGTIMYVGGILSHIVIGILFTESSPETTYTVYQYKEQSAYILILPGLALKIISDIILYFTNKVKPNWLKWKFLMMLILSINAFVFLVPMMPDLVKLAQESISNGVLSQEFIDKEHTEQLVGQSNIIPLLAEIFLGSFKPKLGKERRS
ncbi:enoyl-CoA hydratase [Aureibaculum conchae]|uniref:enoyl-CoA hydratase n=1 Tax=Aureibaculum sp. 2308TA14-22 TaxID=3108392 RepID=UPI0033981B5F